MTAHALPKVPERLLARLEWQVIRRLDGRLMGGYRTAHRGTGTDLAGLRDYVLPDDVGELALDVLRHRLVLSYEALADEVTADMIITKVLDAVAAPDVVLSGR